MTERVVVFDIGGVLVDWQPHLAWMDALGTREAVEAFMERIDFKSRNARADGGARFEDLADELACPEDAALLKDYVSLYPRTIEHRIEGTWDILDRLRVAGVPVHAITNWSAETWPEGLKVQPRLAEVFGVTIVSGEVGVMKPDARIFHTLCARAAVAPEDCIFIDDSPKNVDGARSAGMDGILFTGANALEASLRDLGILQPVRK